MSVSVSSIVPWEQVCRMLDKVQGAKREKKKEMLLRFIDQYKDLINKNKYKTPNDESFFPVMRLLLPSLDRERGAYGVKEKKLADLYIKILGLRKNGVDAQKLLNYKKPKSGGSGVGDFADIAYYVLKTRCPEKGTLSLQEVDKLLTVIAECYITKSHDIMEKSLLQMLRKMTANEQKWLIRVLLKEMHLGIGENAIFNAWHPDAKDFYDVNNSLLKVCTTLLNPEVRLHEIEVSLFAPFRPMRAERVILDKIESQMKHKIFYSETKYDGERSQIHRKGMDYKYFSRNGFDFSANFGTNPSNGLFTPHIHPLFSPNVEEIILDGEMVAWSQKLKTIINKGDHLDVKNLKEGGDWQVCFCAFDILYLNGSVLSNLPLTKRIEKLKSSIHPLEGRVIISSRIEVKSKDDVIRALNDAIDAREEGLVLKDPDSAYQPASRKAGWIKVKPDYVDSLVPELDLVIIGGYYGTGRWQGIIAHFMLGVALTEPGEGQPSSFHSVCKVNSGFTVSELENLLAKLSKQWVPKQPPNVFIGKEKPDIWINPEKSCVVQVRCAELVKSIQFKTGVTLRFPRVDAIRTDKAWHDILTTSELNQLELEGAGKFTGKYQLDEKESAEGSPPKKKVFRESHHPSLPEYFRPADVSNVKTKADVFRGKELCVIGHGGDKSKQELEMLIAEHGGTFSQHPGKKTFAIISDSISVKVQNIINQGLYNVVHPRWLMRCVESCSLCSFSPIEVFFLREGDRRSMEEEYDAYGDSFRQEIDGRRLKEIMDGMTDKATWQPLTKDEMSDLDLLTVDPGGMRGFFRQVDAYFMEDLFLQTGQKNQQEQLTLELVLHGATVSPKLHAGTTHIIIPESMTTKVRRSSYVGHHVVTSKWVRDSLSCGKILSDRLT